MIERMDAAGASPLEARDVAVDVQRLVKRYGDVTAVNGISLDVRAGELFGLIGPDGAGKTTLIRMLVTLLVPDDGTARVLGCDVVRQLWELRRRVGYMPGRFSLYPDLSVYENLRFFASVFGTTIDREYEQIAPIYDQLEPFRERRAAALSGGMKQKLALCCALVHRPDILVLDEPTTGVDAVSRREFWELLGRLKAGGLTVLVSTPYMDEAVRCDRVALMQRGSILAIDTPAAVARSFDRPLFAVRTRERYRALRSLREFPHSHSVFPFGDVLHYADARADAAPEVIEGEVRTFLRGLGFGDAAVAPIPASIEDTFMALMGAPEGEAQDEAHGTAAPGPGTPDA